MATLAELIARAKQAKEQPITLATQHSKSSQARSEATEASPSPAELPKKLVTIPNTTVNEASCVSPTSVLSDIALHPATPKRFFFTRKTEQTEQHKTPEPEQQLAPELIVDLSTFTSLMNGIDATATPEMPTLGDEHRFTDPQMVDRHPMSDVDAYKQRIAKLAGMLEQKYGDKQPFKEVLSTVVADIRQKPHVATVLEDNDMRIMIASLRASREQHIAKSITKTTVASAKTSAQKEMQEQAKNMFAQLGSVLK